MGSSWWKRSYSALRHPLRTAARLKRYAARRQRAIIEERVLASQWLDQDRLRAWQVVNVQRLLRHAYKTTRYYRELFDDRGLRPRDIRSLSDLSQAVPPLTRNIVKARFDDLVSSEWKNSLRLGRTSGSTGTPMHFAHPKPFPEQRSSRAQLADILGLKGNERTLYVVAPALPDGHYRRFDEKRNVTIYSFHDMPAKGLEELVDFAMEWHPEYLYGYVSLLCLLADEFEKRGYTCPSIRIIRTGSEKLYDHQRAQLTRVLGGEVFDHYGSEEISDYGVECHEHNGLHLFSNLRLFELDPATDTGENTGELLVTDFANYAMPFVRYRNGDVITVEQGPCPCGRSLPRATVHGRSIDMLRRRDGSIMRATFFEELVDPRKIARFLVHQRTYDRLDVHLVPTGLFSDAYRDHLLEQISKQTQMSEVNIILEDEIDIKIAGKHRLLRSDVSAQMEPQ